MRSTTEQVIIGGSNMSVGYVGITERRRESEEETRSRLTIYDTFSSIDYVHYMLWGNDNFFFQSFNVYSFLFYRIQNN